MRNLVLATVSMSLACGVIDADSSTAASIVVLTTEEPSGSTDTTGSTGEEPTGGVDGCFFCDEIQALCLSTAVNDELCNRFGSWICVQYNDTACEQLGALCLKQEPPCDQIQIVSDCLKYQASCTAPDVPSTTSGGGGGNQGGTGSSGSSSSTGSSTGEEAGPLD